jgi:solute carrier family 25, member 38
MKEKIGEAVSAHNNILLGAFSGLVIGVALQPLEIIKMNIIINPLKNNQLDRANIIRQFYLSCKSIHQSEGLAGFWRGLAPALIKLMFSSAIYFTLLKELEYFFSHYNIFSSGSNQTHFFSSSLARILSGFFTNPFAVVRTRFEVIGFNQYRNTLDGMKKIYMQEGFKGYFQGALITALRDGPFAGVYFVVYKNAKRALETINEKAIQEKKMNLSLISFTSGIISGIVATIITNPFDVLRARLQFSHYNDEKKHIYSGILDGVRKMYQYEGIAGFMKGISPRLIRKPISNALAFTTYELSYRFVHKHQAF